MATVNPYLYFNGNCEDAFKFYAAAFRKEITYMERYKDVPKTDRQIFKEPDNKIMHATLPISEETSLMGADHAEAYKESNAFCKFSLIIHTETKEETDRLFNELSEDGEVKVPVGLTFWGAYYGQCIDKFGISWKITSRSNT
ncbi:hypothetical protein BFP97_03070 [Roseivirga sp. 4D4]|uniref:VOC family protein n=1 Tax=Roseivirga sp. 4D4 TaxID=1889784 RepID=UPI000852983B|nr:VOC family protein [Roseivirga sp. 4D4]OEK00548.1 hypothetical protein BFP97_03070 [Roseivirga sp. 4D4]